MTKTLGSAKHTCQTIAERFLSGQHGVTVKGAGALLVLTFHDNKFVIRDCAGLHPADVPGREWKAIDSVTFKTSDIKAAARFIRVADSKAKNIINRLMLRDYRVPSGRPLTPTDLKLMPFQELKGVPHILKSNRAYLAHQPGLGKSAQSVAAVNAKGGRALIIAPSFLRVTWAREITKWSTKDFPTIQILPAPRANREINWAADYIVCSDALIAQGFVNRNLREQNFKFIFIDEAHRFKTPDAQRTLALFGGRKGKITYPGLIYEAEHVVALSGTPMLNRPIELWPVLYAMAPELIDFMPYMDFGFRYGGARRDDRGHWIFPGSSNEQELQDRIMGRFIQRITKAQVLKELPEKIREVVVIDKDNRAGDVVALDRDLVRRLRSSGFEKPKALNEYAGVRHANGLAKVTWAADFVRAVLTEDAQEQVILYAHHRDVVAALAKSLSEFRPMVINGGVDIKIRTMIEDQFQNRGRRLIVGNIDSMNLGLTLTKATRVIFAEYAWTPALNEQAEDRAHRIGQNDSVYCQYLVLPNSIDEVILDSIMTKQTRIERVLGE